MSASAGRANRPVRLLLVTLAVLVAAFVILLRYAYAAPFPGTELTLDAAYRLSEAGRITHATLLDEDAVVVGERCLGEPPEQAPAPPAAQAPEQPPAAPEQPPAAPEQPPAAPASGGRCPGEVGEFHTSYPRSDVATQELIETLRRGGATVEVDKQTAAAVAKLVGTFVFPLLLLANLFGLIFLSRSGEGGISEIAGFGSFSKKRKGGSQETSTVTFADVAGADEIVTELREVIDYLQNPERFQAVGATVPKGVLLFGPPGCGKTLTARAVAGEAGVSFFSVSGTEFVESLVGVGAARVRDLFRQVRDAAPAIVFIDEIDAVGRRRSGEGTSGGEREQTLNQLLVELDGFDPSAGIVVIGATNRPDILDHALMRPGRFDRHVTLSAPTAPGRQEILELHARRRRLAPGVDFAALARRTPGFTGADLANVINEAALLALREGEGGQITATHLSEAIQRVLHGPQRRGHLLSAEERRRLAYHESGHAVVAASVGHRSEVPRVSIVARGRGLGQSMTGGDGERVLATGPELNAQLAVAMGGRAAELLVLGSASTTADDDIEVATSLARDMVGLHGLSEEVGPVRLLSKDNGYLGGDTSVLDTVSAYTMQAFDAEVRRLLTSAGAAADKILSANRDQLDRLAARLETEETLEGHALEVLLEGVRTMDVIFPGSKTRAKKQPARSGNSS